jgi:pSer/pThr/pTyr-binding forkhead associated (FHA) protein
MPGRDNAYIDSPVISRDHAVLSADTDAVYLTDSHSMHGTYVDGQKIEPNVPIALSSGSLLQFGVDVNRNEGNKDITRFRASLTQLQSSSLHANTNSNITSLAQASRCPIATGRRKLLWTARNRSP